ncbi:membrane-associated guanylate kinase, WW and PDZ domain-containing protein 2-like isoform X2 [Acanthaster planci]|uniref:Membrane-associated guanylate kinase, WW and PDZ domain-containing protein 2-like isoform X2 n=1 Tax=Acanthaster planci TaxID=133434 RepID=A0A8B7YYE9_ACAPL|nr:membrane-associated guanylate kinase, WW and PDZ domain-containing protein 2-like isoform X2 [Acanthaster planci]
MTKDNKKGTKPPKHWSQYIHEIVVSPTDDGSPNFTVRGGAENGLFPYIADVRSDRILVRSGKLHTDDLLIELNGHKLPGFTLWDIEALLAHIGRAPLHLKTVKQGQTLNKDLRRYLNMRFQKGSVDHDLQQTIRENLYVRTVPCTTRAPREGEVDGVDYKFLSVDEFMALEKSGHLLESGVFDGNHYGTPKPPAKPPPAQSPTSSSSPPPPVQHPQQNNSSSTSPKRSAVHRPGAKPSAPGKRQRNKSTIEATTLNSDPLDEEEQRRREEIQRAEEELGDLPLNWEIAFTDQGDMYFINHVTETTQWLDPRLEHKPIKDLLDCDDDELPYGWEKIDDPQFGTYYIDHINRKTQYANPVLQAKEEARKNDTNKSDGRYPMTLPRSARSSQSSLQAPAPSRALSDPNMQENGHSARPQLSTSPIKTTSDAEWRAMFTNDPDKLKGQTIKTVLKKSKRGFGFTIVGGDDCEEFLQIKSVVPTGPAASDGILKTGDVLVFVKSDATPEPVKVLGYTHQQVVTLFQAIMPGEQVHLEVCRGYPLPFDPDDPNTHIVTSYAISPSSNQPGVKIPGTPSSSAFRKHNSMPSDKIHNNIGPPSYKDTNMTHAASRHQHENRDTPPPPPKISSGHHRNHRNGDSGSNLSREAHVKSLPDLTAAKPQEMEVTGSPRAKTPTLSSNHKPDSLTLPNNVNSRGSVSSEHPSESPSSTQPEIHAIQFVKGNQGFGFTVADSPYGQKVKQILAPANCKTLREGDILVEINGEYIRYLPHNQVVHKLKECPLGVETTIVVQRGGMLKPVRNPNKIKPVKTPKTPEPRDKNEGPNLNEFRTSEDRDNVNHRPHSNGPYRGDSYSSDEYDSRDEDQGMRHHRHGRERASKSPRTVKREETYDHEERHRDHEREKGKGEPRHHYRDQDRIPNENGPIHGHHSDHRPHADHDSDRSWDKEVDRKANDHGNRRGDPRRQHERNDRRLAENERRSTERDRRPNRDPNRRRDDPDRPVVDYETRSLERKRRPRSPEHDRPVSRPERSRTPKYDYDSRENRPPPKSPGMERQGHPLIENGTKSLRRDQRGHPEDGRGQEGRRSRPGGESGTGPRSRTPKPHHSTSPVNRSDDVIGQRPPSRAKQPAKAPVGNNEDNFIETTVFLKKLDNGFGFRIVGGREEQSQVAIGNIVPNGAADLDGRLVTGDELLYIDGQSVIGSSHQEVVNLMVKASQAGRVSLGIRRKISPSASEPMGKNPVDRRPFSEPPPPNSPSSPTRPNAVTFPYDVTIHRRASEGFGLVILSSTLTSGSKIGRIIKGSPTDRCGKVKVGDRLIAVNKVDIMNMHHKDIVNMIKDAGLSVTLTIGPPEDPVAGNSPKAHDSMTNALAMPAHIKSSDTSLLPRDSFREGPQSPVTPTADLYSHQHEPQYPTAQRWRPPSVPVRADNRDHVSSSRSTPQPNYNQRSPTSYNPHPYQQHQQSSVPYSESSRDTYTRSADYPTEPYPTDRHPHQYPQPVDSYPAPHHPQHQHAAYRRTQEPSMPPNHGMFDDQPEIEPGDYYAVDLERGTMGFGFSIRGGREFQNTPLFVLRMAEEGPAARNGLVRVGDQIIEINGHSTDGMLHSEAIDVIRRGGNRVRLLLRRAGPPPASDGAREGMFKTGSNSSLRSADQAFYKHHYPDHHHQSKGSSHQVEPFDSWSYRSLPRGMRY